jgi:hypothetical protein
MAADITPARLRKLADALDFLSNSQAFEVQDALRAAADQREKDAETIERLEANCAALMDGYPLKNALIEELRGYRDRLLRQRSDLTATLAARDALLVRLATAFGCKAGRDGECIWPGCPQRRDNEPDANGRHCPRDIACGDPSCDATDRANRALAAEIAAALGGQDNG